MTPPTASLSALEATQPKAVRLLTSALRHGRLPHAILVVGPSSTPVLPLCQALTARLVCHGAPTVSAAAAEAPSKAPFVEDPCGACAGCRMNNQGTHPNIAVVQGNERGVISVAQVRAASAKLHLRPQNGGLSVLRIDGAQGMQKGAQNALLKTLEEPPGESCIIMGCQSLGLLLPTILSRVVRVVLAPPLKAKSVAALAQAGIDSPYAELLAPQTGANTNLAQSMMDAGFVQTVGTVREALTVGLPVQTTQATAAALAQNPAHFDMAVALLELLMRDALAQMGGAQEPLMTQPGVANVLTQLPAETVSRGIDQLMLLRRQRKLNINRAQALEGLFLTLNHRGTV